MSKVNCPQVRAERQITTNFKIKSFIALLNQVFTNPNWKIFKNKG